MGVGLGELKRIITQVREADWKEGHEETASSRAFQGFKEKQGILWVGGSHGGKHTFTVLCASWRPASAHPQ